MTGVAELLVDAVHADDDMFTPSPAENDALCQDYDKRQATILATWDLVKQAQLPVSTFSLAVLILQRLKPSFYAKWIHCLWRYSRTTRKKVYYRKEMVIMAAIVHYPDSCDCANTPDYRTKVPA
jgi:hypothetical protein